MMEHESGFSNAEVIRDAATSLEELWELIETQYLSGPCENGREAMARQSLWHRLSETRGALDLLKERFPKEQC